MEPSWRDNPRYAAYRDLVEQGGIDAFVFLGDYIYEYATGGYATGGSSQTKEPPFTVQVAMLPLGKRAQ